MSGATRGVFSTGGTLATNRGYAATNHRGALPFKDEARTAQTASANAACAHAPECTLTATISGSPYGLTARLALGRVQSPLAGDAFELMRSAILEGEPRAGDEISDRPRDQDFSRPCGGSDACANRDGDAGHLAVG